MKKLTPPYPTGLIAGANLLVVVVLAALLPLSSTAASCFSDEKLTAELSAKHKSELNFVVDRSDKDVDVSVEFPSIVEGEGFSRIWLHIATDDSVSVVAPLSSFESGSKLKVWFVVGLDLAASTKIQIVYGEECGLTIEYEIPLSAPTK